MNWAIQTLMDIKYSFNELLITYDLELKISKITKSYSNATDAFFSPIAGKIFGFPWVEEVTVAPNSITIKRQDWVDFDIIAEPLKELIEEHFKSSSNNDPIEENTGLKAKTTTGNTNTSDDQINNAGSLNGTSSEFSQIADFLDQEVNPMVASHGGKITLVNYNEGLVELKMEGGCQGCGMAQVTLRDGVEKSLKENFSFITSIKDTTDHKEGLNPFIK
jgi:Fe-S cluster biogenesis protein NfuA